MRDDKASVTGPDPAISVEPEMEKLIRQTRKIGHDLNNLLTIIALNLEITQEKLGDAHPVQEMLTPALRAARNAADLTALLLAQTPRR